MRQNKRRTVFTFIYAQVSIICLFGFVTAFTLLRLLDVRDNLSVLSDEAIPQITQSASFNNNIQILATQTTILASAQNEPARRLVMQRIETLLAYLLNRFDNTVSNDQAIAKKMSTINAEIIELNALITQKIELERDLSLFTKNFKETIIASIIAPDLATANFAADTAVVDTELPADITDVSSSALKERLMQLLVLTMQIEGKTRLSAVRQLESELDLATSLAIEQYEKLNLSSEQNLALANTLLQFKRLIAIKVDLLLIDGRARGRDNFLRNLMLDLSSNLEYQTEMIHQTILTSAADASKRVTKQAKIVLTLSAITIFITVCIIIFLYRRFVVRLISLTRQIDLATDGGKGEINIDGSDEIAHLSSVFSSYIKKVRKQEKILMNLSLSDPLTNIPNRRAFELKLFDAIAQAKRSHLSLSIIIADVDFFKAFNDRYGHTEGDSCLQQVARQLQKTVARNTDICARFGGEEFICILTDTDSEGAKRKAEQIHHAIHKLQIKHADSSVGDYLTLSLGVATFSFLSNTDWSSKTIIEEADRALYQAKNSGRNKSCFSVNS